MVGVEFVVFLSFILFFLSFIHSFGFALGGVSIVCIVLSG